MLSIYFDPVERKYITWSIEGVERVSRRRNISRGYIFKKYNFTFKLQAKFNIISINGVRRQCPLGGLHLCQHSSARWHQCLPESCSLHTAQYFHHAGCCLTASNAGASILTYPATMTFRQSQCPLVPLLLAHIKKPSHTGCCFTASNAGVVPPSPTYTISTISHCTQQQLSDSPTGSTGCRCFILQVSNTCCNGFQRSLFSLLCIIVNT